MSAESEHGLKSRIDSPLFFWREMPGEVPEAGHVDSTDVFDKYPGQDPFYLDLRSERSRSRTRRGGRHQHYGAGQQGIGLHDDPVPWPVLFVPHSLGKPQREDVTPAHAGFP